VAIACSLAAGLAGFGLNMLITDSPDRTPAPAPVDSVDDALARSRAADSARLQAQADAYLAGRGLPRSADGASGWLESQAALDAAARGLPRSADGASGWLEGEADLDAAARGLPASADAAERWQVDAP
jgi:hypothetical protein